MKHRILLFALIALSISSVVTAAPEESKGIVTNVIDGNTFEVQDVGIVRLADVICPDIVTQEGLAAKAFTEASLLNKLVYLDLDDKSGRDLGGRIICVAYLAGSDNALDASKNFNKMIVDSGCAKVWDFTTNEFNPANWWGGAIPVGALKTPDRLKVSPLLTSQQSDTDNQEIDESTRERGELYNNNLSFEIPIGWKVAKDIQNGNDTQIVLSDNTSAIRIDLVKSTDQELDRLMADHLKERTPISGNDSTSHGLWKLIYSLTPWEANGVIGSYYKNKVTDTAFTSYGSGISIKPDGAEQASVYNSREEPPLEWVLAWTKPGYDGEFISIHTLFSGKYKEIPFEWPGSGGHPTMQQPLYIVLTTITKGDKLKSTSLTESV